MSRTWSIGLVVFAAVAMWLVVGWPARNESKPEAGEPREQLATAGAATPKPVSPPLAPKPDAVAPEPEEEAPAPAAAPPPGPAPWPQGDILAGDRGPVAEYRAQYEREARDSKATDVEGAVRTAFGHSKRPDLLHSTSCHENICRVLIRWSPDRAHDYIQSVRWLALGTSWPPGQPGFDSKVAIASGSESDKEGSRIVELYLKRRPAELARQPAEPADLH
jgi:hypothetical protein